MKTGTLALHGSHNYGSMLQAYALQQTMIRIFGHNEIVNLRTHRQNKLYKPISIPSTLRGLIKTVVSIPFLPVLYKKADLFEEFLSKQLLLTAKKETVTDDDVKEYDILCAGSDQVWNPNMVDFSRAYYLPFKYGGKKISYAPSMGPIANVPQSLFKRLSDCINNFDYVSAREEGTKLKVEEISGRKDIQVLPDPVLLLESSEWRNKFINSSLIDRKLQNRGYIFMYSLFSDDDSVKCAKELSRQMNFPVVVTSFTNLKTIISGDFIKKYASGPIEFLNYLYHAKAVVTTSFHGTAFSILFNKPFIAVNGMNDNRISNILSLSNLTSCAVTSADEVDVNKITNLDFAPANTLIEKERNRGIAYLQSIKSAIEHERADL